MNMKSKQKQKTDEMINELNITIKDVKDQNEKDKIENHQLKQQVIDAHKSLQIQTAQATAKENSS